MGDSSLYIIDEGINYIYSIFRFPITTLYILYFLDEDRDERI